MVIFKKISDLQDYLLKLRATDSRRVGFVPTMGALHAGHISLIGRSKANNDIAVASIFVNPTQFNDRSDFDKYPSSVDMDITMLVEAGCDVLLLPSEQEVYPEGDQKMQSYGFGYLDNILEGAQRPGHFKGVGQVVARLLDIVNPDFVYVGQKDYQQCIVIKNLIGLLRKENEITLMVCPTVREADGLAMSSRNRRLTEPQRAIAGLLYQCLVSIQAKQIDSSFKIVQKECLDLLAEKGFTPEYVSLADAGDLSLLEEYDKSKKMVALVAAKLGDVRLIDNLVIN
ncbi:pantoate--beta-alanine ligase [Polluticoccus soli]|uniref:pantoate--beta-alanine ligase n=1 Tax=Polluticoccus soli TaxID=3034150 RepID=UPI0023E23771|nr:pantoate--beta-alanine ligase [Flavipsychrobacter sp. JY13-12]